MDMLRESGIEAGVVCKIKMEIKTHFTLILLLLWQEKNLSATFFSNLTP